MEEPSSAEQHPIHDVLYNQVKGAFKNGVTVANAINIITYTMAAVERTKNMSGPEKKEAVVFVITRLVDEIPVEQEDKAAIQSAVRLLLPGLVDSIASAAKGQLDINKIAQQTGNCWRSCFPCCFGS